MAKMDSGTMQKVRDFLDRKINHLAIKVKDCIYDDVVSYIEENRKHIVGGAIDCWEDKNENGELEYIFQQQ